VTVHATTTTADRRAALVVAGAAILAAGAVLPPPWTGGIVAATAFVLPGRTVLWLLDGEDRTEPVLAALLSVLVSTVIVILTAIALDLAGIAVGRASVALALATVQLWLAVAVMALPTRRGPVRGPSRGHGRAARRITWRVPVAAVAGAGSLVVAVVGVRALAPATASTPYARLSWTDQAATTGGVPVDPGPVATAVTVEAVGSTGTAELRASLDGVPLAPPATVVLGAGLATQVALHGTVPRLDGCLHRLEVQLTPPEGSGDLTLTRYVRGRGAPPCAPRPPPGSRR